MAGPATAAVTSSIVSSSFKYCVTSKSSWHPLLQQRLSVAAVLSKSNLIETFASRRIGWRAPRMVLTAAAAAMVGGDQAPTPAAAVTSTEKVVVELDAAQAAKEEEEVVNTKLYFGNLPYNVDSAELAGIIQDYASPELVEVLYDRETGRGRGFAFVTMSTVEECNAVIQNLDGTEYLGRIMKVNFSDKPKPKEPLYPETEHKLFVGNLSWSVTSDSLTKAFQQYGTVVGARVLFDGETGRSRGYGFVCYQTKSEMETALESLNGFELEGRAIRVYLAEAKR